MSAKGHWNKEGEPIEITDTQLVWSNGKADPVTLAKDGSLTMTQDNGKTYTATLKDNGKELVWSDGKAWTRIETINSLCAWGCQKIS